MKRHNIKTTSKALHRLIREKDARIKTLEAECEKQKVSFMAQNLNVEKSKVSNGEISEKPCEMMVYIEKKPMCGDPQAPISSFMKTHLNAQVCALCRKLRKTQLQEVKGKEQEDVKRLHSDTKTRVRNLVKRINEPIQPMQKTMCPHLKSIVLVKKCERCLENDPYRYTACQQEKAETQTSIEQS